MIWTWPSREGLTDLRGRGVAKKKTDETLKPKPSEAGGRVSVIHLQGPIEERDWLTVANKKTHLSKATIVRLALREWGTSKGLQPYPMQGDED